MILRQALAAFLFSLSLSALPVATDLGALNFGASAAAPNVIQIATGDFNAGEIKWYQFTLSNPLPGTLFLDIFTTQDITSTETVTATDTEIGLYDALGNLLANNDDSGASLFSILTFSDPIVSRAYVNQQPAGTTLPAAFDGADLTGAAATLPAGTYYLAVGRFNVTFGLTNFTVTSASTSTSNNRALLALGTGDFKSDSEVLTPEPATLTLSGAALLAAILLRRRR